MKKIFIMTMLLLVIITSGCTKKKTDLYSDIISKNQINIGVKEDAKPFGFKDTDGNLQGFDIDLGNKIAESLGAEIKVNFVPVTTANRIMMLNSGKVDIVIATMSITPKRITVVDFSTPYYIAGQTFLVPANSNIKSTADLRNKKIITVFGSTAEKNAKLTIPDAKLIGYKTYQAAMEALKQGAADALAADDTILLGIVEDNNNFKIMTKRYTKEPYAIAFRKDDQSKSLKIQVDKILENLRKSGELDKLKRKWIKI